ncbi:hypothetical protein SAMN05192548_103827 [Paraburkholderia terricola]|uniref:Uncharacterized protein n=1 Tax=Paraburkholderia terricola TaxID=169427 RepID=A0A1M6VC36_9BURK|nr:hypothetical protein SAMN05192547_103727 [Paraburkholderia sediminicola]SHK78866.1 hypothetical protein SAMN05192548_103827 [Paraburkholderia terricola]
MPAHPRIAHHASRRPGPWVAPLCTACHQHRSPARFVKLSPCVLVDRGQSHPERGPYTGLIPVAKERVP